MGLARSCPHSQGPCFFALFYPAASPSLQVFRESAGCFLALLPELLAEPADSEMRLCQQSLLVRRPCFPSPHPLPQGQKLWGWVCVSGGAQGEDHAPSCGI